MACTLLRDFTCCTGSRPNLSNSVTFTGLPEAISSFNNQVLSGSNKINGRPAYSITFQLTTSSPPQRQRYTLWYAAVEKMWILGLANAAGRQAEGFLCMPGEADDPTQVTAPWAFFDPSTQDWVPQQGATCLRTHPRSRS
jgi:hypothetical protein